MKIAVIGAGLMGRAAVFDLARIEGVQSVGVFDIDGSLAEEIALKYGDGRASHARLDASDGDAAASALEGFDACVSCVTYSLNPGLTRAAIKSRAHLVDLGGNNDVVRTQLAMSEEASAAGVTVIPDCGLAPGMVAVLAADGVVDFDEVESLKIRVGGLPQRPRPPLNYQMVFSAEGLINEYWEPCLILEDGKKKTVNPMSSVERLEFDGIGELEAFYTSGGTSTLPDTFEGKIGFLDYKTIRYPGHCRLFKMMLEIGLASRQPLEIAGVKIEPRSVLKAVLDKNLTFNEPDLVLVRLTLEGTRKGARTRRIYEIVDRQDLRTGLTAMMRTTAFPATIVAWMLASGQVEKTGCYPQEIAIDSKRFIPELKRRNINLAIRDGPLDQG
jgi:lysine 6-dehydrogenase